MPLAFMTTSLISYAGGILPAPTGVVITKYLNNKKHKIRLLNSSDKKTLLFTVDGVESKLISESVIRNRETGILPGIPAGTYLYEVMVDDTRIENGQLKIK